ncbi:MAG: DUF2382 domain-containing protein [Leptolyngbyaceae cyanobacterium]
MPLYKIEDRYPDYQERFEDGDNIMGVDIYARKKGEVEKVGNVDTVLVDGAGRIRYLVVDTGFWVFGKKVLLPIGRCMDDPENNRIYAVNLSKHQVENLPEYTDAMVVDYDYEERVRSVYLMSAAGLSAPIEMSAPVEQAGVRGYVATPAPAPAPVSPGVKPQPEVTADPEPATDVYDRTPELYALSDDNHRRIRLYEERLVADKRREKTGEVKVTKRIETEQTEASVPVQKEKIVIEIESVAGATRVNTPNGSFQEGEVAQMDVYEERADIRKEPFVRQEVNIRKEIEKDVVTAQETARREELNVQKEGSPDIVDRSH